LLVGFRQEPGSLIDEATAIFEALGAQPWLDRARALHPAVPA
jgi:hypothetical protein